MTRLLRVLAVLLSACVAAPCAAPVVLNDDGGWCWFEDERALIDAGKLVAGTVASGARDPARRGDIEVAVYDFTTRKTSVVTLHRAAGDGAWVDDHNSPAFLVRPDGRIIAVYAKHGAESKIYYRISSRPHDATAWDEEKIFIPSPSSRVTYSNLHLLARENGGKGRIYDFYRGFDNSFKPSWAWSDDGGETWRAGRVFIDVPGAFRHRPYVKYASNGTDTVHFAYTEGHPRNFDNSIYHVFYREGKLMDSSGRVIRTLEEGLKAPEEGTRVYRGGGDNVAWTSDVHLDGDGRPAMVFSVQMNSAGKPPETSGDDFRYHYARWSGSAWQTREIAFGGSKLYPQEDDYTGNICIDPQDVRTVYISTNADPVTGKPLVSKADNQRHWEIYRGRTRDGSAWRWTAVTRDSRADNIRPIVPIAKGGLGAVLWLQGKMRAYTDYDFQVVALPE
jgi:hypothetical protein